MMADIKEMQSVIEELQRGQEQMRETVSMIAMAIPSLNVKRDQDTDAVRHLDIWDAVLYRVSPKVRSILKPMSLSRLEHGAAVIACPVEAQFQRSSAEREHNRAEIEQAFLFILGRPIRVTFEVLSDHEFEQDADGEATGDINDRATLEAVRRIAPATSYTMADAQHAAKIGCRICDTKKARDHNKAAKSGKARCRLPVKSQFCAWVALNIDEVEQFDFHPPTMLDIVIAIAELQGANINFAKQGNDWMAMKWLDQAWKWLPKTRRTIDNGLPF